MSFFQGLPQQLLNPPEDAVPGVRMRMARKSDLQLLHAACYPERPLGQVQDSLQRSLRAQATGNRIHLVAVKEGELIGTAQLIGYTHKAEITDLVVASSFRNQGVGTTLITILTRIAAHSGFRLLEIGAMAANVQALELYKRLGFSPAREVGLSQKAKAIILQKRLTPPTE